MEAADGFDLGELRDLFAEVVGEATSDGGLITVSVDNKGRVDRVVIHETLTGTPVDRLAEVVDEYQRQHHLAPDVLRFLKASVTSLKGPGTTATGTNTPAPGSHAARNATSATEYDDDYTGDPLISDPLGRHRRS